MILAFILLLILPVAYIVYSQFSESSRVMQAQVAVDRLKRTADMVYYQAPGAKQFVTVSLPGGVDWTNSYIGKPGTANGTVLSKEISLKVYTRAGATEVWRSTKGEVKGYWPGAPGTYRYIVKKMDEGYVLIVPYEISFLLDPSSYSTNLQPGGSTSFTLNITNLESQAKTIDLDAGGDIATWISFSDDPVTLPADGSATSEVTITVPSNQAFGYYTSEVIATYENETAYVYIGVVVTGTGVGGAANVSTGMLLEILSPENTTYHDPLIPLIYWTNESTNWCGWSLNGGRFYTVSDNTTVLATKYGSNYLEMMCLSNEGDYGYDNVYFTSIYTTTCANRTVYSAIQDTLEDNTELVSESDDLRANMENTLSNTLAELTQWSSFLSIYSDYTNMSFSLDMYNVSTYLNNGILVLRNDGMEYRWQGDMFYFNHSSANINITIDTNDVLNYTWVPPLENSGDVAVVVTVGNYTSDQKWVKYGTSYIGFFNLTSDSNITINFTESANIIINYTNAPSTFNQTIDISSGIKWMYPIFGDERIDSSSTTNPGWIEPSYPDEANPTKHYGSSSNYNFIVADINNDGSYDALYVDTNNDLDFTDTKDIRFLTNGSVADFSGKAFYTIFANNGNWIEIYKVLAVYASDSSGTAIKPVKV